MAHSMGFFGHVPDVLGQASLSERVMMTVGMLCAVVAGLTIPLNALVLGYQINAFIFTGTNRTEWKEVDLGMETLRLVKYGLMVASGCLVGSYGAVLMWTWSAARLGAKIRIRYFRSLLSQSLGWFEVNQMAELVHRFKTDIPALVNGFGDKVPISVQWLTTWLMSHIVAFSQSWKLTLAIMFFSPAVYLVNGYIRKLVQEMTIQEYQAYVTSGFSAEAALLRISTTQTYNAYEWEISRYAALLQTPRRLHIRKAMILGIGVSVPWIVNIAAYAVAFGFGHYLEETEGLQPGRVFPVLFGVLHASASVQQAFVNLDTIMSARTSVTSVMEVLHQVSPIDCFSDAGRQPKAGLKGSINFKGVFFRFPARLDVKVLNSFDMRIKAGETVVLLGEQSSGIFAIPKLIHRCYDIQKGQILIDGFDIREYNVRWLREQMRYVTRDPVVFAASVSENIRIGNARVTQEQIEAAAMAVDAHDFIMDLPHGYDTIVYDGTKFNKGHTKTPKTCRERPQRRSYIFHRPPPKSSINISKSRRKTLQRTSFEQASRSRSRDSSGSISDTEPESIFWIQVNEEVTTEAHGSMSIAEQSFVRSDHTGKDKLNEDKQEKPRARSEPDMINAGAGNFRVDSAIHLNEEAVALTAAQCTQLTIARAFVSRPAILLIDDVMSGALDCRMRETMKKNIGAIQEALGRLSDSRLQGRQQMKSVAATFEAVAKRMQTGIKQKEKEEDLKLEQSADERSISAESNPLLAESKEYPIARLLRLQSADLFFISLGLLMSAVLGLAPLGLAFVVAEMVAIWYDKAQGVKKDHFYPYTLIVVMLGLGIVVALLRVLVHYSFSVASTRLTTRVRVKMFATLLRQVVGQRTGALVETVTTMVGGLTLALLSQWHTALVIAAFAPLPILGSVLQGKVHVMAETSHNQFMAEASAVFMEAVENIVTVTLLNMKQLYMDRLTAILGINGRQAVKYAHLHGLGHGFINVIIFVYTAIFFFAYYLIQTNQATFDDIFMYDCSGTADMDIHNQPKSTVVNYTRAKTAARKLFRLIDTLPAINSPAAGGTTLKTFSGEIMMKDVVFRYPSQPLVRVLNEFNLMLKPRQTVALVGPSHSGKTTVLKILQHFYNIDSGSVADGTELHDLDLVWWRSQLGVVHGKPHLTDGTVKDNIAYGDSRDYVPLEEIISAARKADIHETIMSLSHGYDTEITDNGSSLFDAKQILRLAIARAVFKNPSIFLVDNITASLESANQKEVLKTLHKVTAGRTCVIATSRVTEVTYADVILVLSHGRVIEQGSHTDLWAQRGCYAVLWVKQENQRKAQQQESRKKSRPTNRSITRAQWIRRKSKGRGSISVKRLSKNT